MFLSQNNGVFSLSPFLLLYFEKILWFLLMDDCNHLLGLLITLEITLMRNRTISILLLWSLFHLKFYVEQSSSIFYIIYHQLSKEKKHLSIYQFSINQDNQNRTNIWQVIHFHSINNIKSWCDKFLSVSIPHCTPYYSSY